MMRVPERPLLKLPTPEGAANDARGADCRHAGSGAAVPGPGFSGSCRRKDSLMRPIVFALVAWVVLAGPVQAAGAWPARLVRVVDGDTAILRVMPPDQKPFVQSVRFRGVDTPELKGLCESERRAAGGAAGKAGNGADSGGRGHSSDRPGAGPLWPVGGPGSGQWPRCGENAGQRRLRASVPSRTAAGLVRLSG